MFSFTKNKVWFLLLPIIIIAIGVVFYFVNGGFNMDIDFVGGVKMTVATEGKADMTNEAVKDAVKAATGIDATVQSVSTNQMMIKTVPITDEQKDAVFAAVKEKFSLTEEQPLSTSTASPNFGIEMQQKALLFALIAALLMLVYISIRFEWRSGVMAVVTLLMNVLVMVSVYVTFKVPINTTFVAAILTIIGYSINDTIVIFDRIRENVRMSKKESYNTIVDRSIAQSITRSINTSITTLITIVLLYILGVPSVKDFAFPLIIGVIIGTYTSIFVASPLWAAWKETERLSQKQKKSR